MLDLYDCYTLKNLINLHVFKLIIIPVYLQISSSNDFSGSLLWFILCFLIYSQYMFFLLFTIDLYGISITLIIKIHLYSDIGQ